MMRLWIGLLALAVASVWAAALASAEMPFRFDDAPADAMPPAASAWADLVVGEATVDADALVATLQLSLLPEMQPGVAYVFLFHDGERDRYLAAYTSPTLAYAYGFWTDGPEDFQETTGSYASGPGGTVTVEMPRAALGNATLLTAPRGAVYDIKPDATPIGGFVALDEAAGEAELRLDAPATPATPATPSEQGAAPAATEEPSAATPGFAPLLALAALALAARAR